MTTNSVSANFGSGYFFLQALDDTRNAMMWLSSLPKNKRLNPRDMIRQEAIGVFLIRQDPHALDLNSLAQTRKYAMAAMSSYSVAKMLAEQELKESNIEYDTLTEDERERLEKISKASSQGIPISWKICADASYLIGKRAGCAREGILTQEARCSLEEAVEEYSSTYKTFQDASDSFRTRSEQKTLKTQLTSLYLNWATASLLLQDDAVNRSSKLMTRAEKHESIDEKMIIIGIDHFGTAMKYNDELLQIQQAVVANKFRVKPISYKRFASEVKEQIKGLGEQITALTAIIGKPGLANKYSYLLRRAA